MRINDGTANFVANENFYVCIPVHDTRILSSKFIARFSVISPRPSRIGKFHIEIGSERILYAVSVRFFLAKRKLKMRENDGSSMLRGLERVVCGLE